MYVFRNIEGPSRIIVAVKKQYVTYWFECACVRPCGHRSAWACACIYVRIALIIQHATRMRHIVTSLVAPRSPPNFSTLSQKWCGF